METKSKSIEKVIKPEATPAHSVVGIRQRTVATPQLSSALGVQSAAGNLAVQRMFRSGMLQTKLAVGSPNDPLENEANRVAEQVVHTKAEHCHCGGSCADCQSGKEGLLQRKPETHNASNPSSNTSVPNHFRAQLGSGNSLDSTTRSFFESRFGHDFSQVQVHTGEQAASSAQGINAHAFTLGQNVVFGAGQYAPSTTEGKRLLAHELTHVVQQKQGKVSGRNILSRHVILRQPATEANPMNEPTPPPQTIQAQTRTSLPTTTEAARNLSLWLSMPNPTAHLEQILQTLLLMRGTTEDLKATFQQVAGQSLVVALEANLSGNDLIRAKSYLQYGTLRLADKIYFAVHGIGTDEDTLYRLMPQVHRQMEEVDKDLRADYSQDYPKDGSLPNGATSRTAGILEDELSGWELDQAKAYLAYGELRPVDQIRIATNRIGTDEDMLFAALEKSNKATVRQDYQASYGESLDEVLKSELSGNDKKRADLILAGSLTALEKIRLAVEGLGTDEQAIYDAISNATEDERKALKLQFDDQASKFYKMLADDLNAEEMFRVGALLSGGNTALDKLMQIGALSGSDIIDTVKMSSSDTLQLYQRDFNDPNSGFRLYLNQETDESDRKALNIILNGSTEERLQWAVKGLGTDEDYIFHILQNLDNTTKRSLTTNTALMNDLSSDLSTSDFARVQDLLRPSDLSPEERVKSTGEQIERERSWLTDLFSNASDALSDENRELNAALDRARADGEISPEEQKEIEHFQAETDTSLAVYKKVRDEIEETAANILTTAAAITVAVLSAGTLSGASAAIIAAQLAQVALVSAVARVAAMKVAHGDRFDVFGADGATAFGAGAIDGVMNVLGAPAAKALVGSLLLDTAESAARQAASSSFKTLGREMLQKAVEGGLTAAGSSAFTAAANERTWSQGFLTGLGNVAESTGIAVATGAVGSAAFHAAGAGYSAVRDRFSKEVAEAGEGSLAHALTGAESSVPGSADAARRAAESVETTPEARATTPNEPEPKAKPDNEPPTTAKEKEFLASTTPKEGSQLTPQELNAELELLAKAKPKPISEGPYVEEIELPNGHKWKRSEDGSWCRFSSQSFCVPRSAVEAGGKTLQAKLEEAGLRDVIEEGRYVVFLHGTEESFAAALVEEQGALLRTRGGNFKGQFFVAEKLSVADEFAARRVTNLKGEAPGVVGIALPEDAFSRLVKEKKVIPRTQIPDRPELQTIFLPGSLDALKGDGFFFLIK